jgi:hypothetical protein
LTFNSINGEIFDDYNPNSSFIYLIDGVTGAKTDEIAFSDNNFVSDTSVVLTFNNNDHDGKDAILYQKSIRRNNSPKIKYLKMHLYKKFSYLLFFHHYLHLFLVGV